MFFVHIFFCFLFGILYVKYHLNYWVQITHLYNFFYSLYEEYDDPLLFTAVSTDVCWTVFKSLALNVFTNINFDVNMFLYSDYDVIINIKYFFSFCKGVAIYFILVVTYYLDNRKAKIFLSIIVLNYSSSAFLEIYVAFNHSTFPNQIWDMSDDFVTLSQFIENLYSNLDDKGLIGWYIFAHLVNAYLAGICYIFTEMNTTMFEFNYPNAFLFNKPNITLLWVQFLRYYLLYKILHYIYLSNRQSYLVVLLDFIWDIFRSYINKLTEDYYFLKLIKNNIEMLVIIIIFYYFF